MKSDKRKINKGFTLSEVGIVLVIATLLVSGAVWAINNSLNTSKANLTRHDIAELRSAHTMYYIKNGSFTTDQNLVNLKYIEANEMWNGSAMVDRWGRPYVEELVGDTLTISVNPASQSKMGGPYSVSCTVN